MRPDAEAALLRLAAKQHSVFTRAQALAGGLSKRAIDGRLKRGLWIPLHRGVYVVSSVSIGDVQRIAGACLSCGPGAVASYNSASLIWAFSETLGIPHVSVPPGTDRERPDVVIHVRSGLSVVTRGGFRVTAPMLTLLDLAEILPEERLERVLDNAHRRGLVQMARLRAYVDQPTNLRRPGSGVLRAMVDARLGARAIGSDLETLLLRAIRAAGLPLPVPQHPVITCNGERFIDYAYPEHMIAVELDGLERHGLREVFDDDHVRQNDLEELGWRFRRFTWTQVRTAPTEVAFTVGKALGLVPVRWGQPRAVAFKRSSNGRR